MRTAWAFRWPAVFAPLVATGVLGGLVLGERGGAWNVLALGAALAASAAGAAFVVRSVRQAQSAALRDPLTGLPNRALLADRSAHALRQARRLGTAFTVVVADLNGFKRVNDEHGHAAGDAVLVQIAARLERALRASDTVARVGGDEFVVVSLDARDQEGAERLAVRIREALLSPFVTGDASVTLGVSLGWAIFPDDGDDVDELLARADRRMYEAKRTTGSPAAPPARVPRPARALTRDDLVVHYQPVIDLESGDVRNVEALVRRRDLRGGLLAAADFLPALEGTPEMRALTLHVVEDALASLGRWRNAGHELGVSVNVPFEALEDDELAARIAALTDGTELSASSLTLEVAPTGAASGTRLAALGEIGVRLSLDDFGRHSLEALHTLPLDEVKIDRALVAHLHEAGVDASIVQALAGLGRTLGLEVVAEGVEHRETWELLAESGCTLAQGYSIAPPRSADDVTRWLDRRLPAAAAVA